MNKPSKLTKVVLTVLTPQRNGNNCSTKIHVSYAADKRPEVWIDLADIDYTSFTQVSRLLSGLCGKKISVVSWFYISGAGKKIGKVVLPGETYS